MSPAKRYTRKDLRLVWTPGEVRHHYEAKVGDMALLEMGHHVLSSPPRWYWALWEARPGETRHRLASGGNIPDGLTVLQAQVTAEREALTWARTLVTALESGDRRDDG